MNSTNIIFLLLITLGVFLGYYGYKRSRNNSFYNDTHWLIPFGIFVWGDALVLGPFISIVSLFFFLAPVNPFWAIRLYLIFWLIRSLGEVFYWLGKQTTKSNFKAPVLRDISWLKSEDSQIIMQVFHTALATLALFFLLLSFS